MKPKAVQDHNISCTRVSGEGVSKYPLQLQHLQKAHAIGLIEPTGRVEDCSVSAAHAE